MKKFLLLLSFVLVAMHASAYFKVGDIYYQPDEQADDGTCWVRDSPYYGEYENLTSVTIPGRVTYNGRVYRVTSIDSEAFRNATALTTVRVGWGVEEIGSYAFSGCSNLKYVYLPSTIKRIYSYAFQNCTSMIQMGIAASTPPTLYTNPFAGMRTCNIFTALHDQVSAYNSITAWTTADANGAVDYSGTAANDFVTNGLCFIITSSTTSINGEATLVGIENGTTYLPMAPTVTDYTNQTYGAGSSYSCDFREIAPYAAYRHSTLKTIGRSDLGSYFRLKKVGSRAFYNCPALTSVNISAQEIGSYAFYSCYNLTTVNLYLKDNESYGTQQLGTECFARTGVTYQYIPTSVTSYGDGAFALCTSLTGFRVSDSHTLFTTYAGWLCSKDYDIIYQVGAGDQDVGTTGFYRSPTTTIRAFSFAGCTKATMLKIPYGVKNIGNYAFFEAKFTGLLIPSSVTSIGPDVFTYMSNLEHLYYNIATPTTGLSFTGLKSGCVLSVPYTSMSAYSNNSTWSSAFTGGIDGKAYDLTKLDDSGTKSLYYTVTSVGTYTDPVASTATFNGQAKIVRGEMSDQTYSGTIDIPLRYYSTNYLNFAITEIDYRAFNIYTHLKTIYGGDCVKTIGEEAFNTCWDLTTVSLPHLVSIGKKAFYDCTKLASFNMGNRLESIGVSAFYNCKALAGEISLPATLANIDATAFANCTNLHGLFVNRTQTTTFGRNIYAGCASDFACWVPLNQFYNFYSKMKSTVYSSSPETDSKCLLPWIKPTSQWTAISVPVDDDVLLPADGEFYIATSFDRLNKLLGKTQLSNSNGIKGYEGMLLKGTAGTTYRFRRKTDVSNYTYVTPSVNYLKGVTGPSQGLPYNSAGPWYYIFNGTDRFNRYTSTQTVYSGSAYVELTNSSTSGSASISTVYIEDISTPYNLWINGVQVTSVNCTDLSPIPGVSGTVTYTPGTKTLKLSNATLTCSTANNIKNQISGLKINLVGSNLAKITSGNYAALSAEEPTTITGSGSLDGVSASYDGCMVKTGSSLTVSGGAQVFFGGKYYGIYGGSTTSKLIVSGASTNLTANGTTNASIYRVPATLNDGLAITSPTGAYFNSSGTVVDATGNTIKNKTVMISKPAFAIGDVNEDGNIDITDVTLLINAVLTGDFSAINSQAANCYADSTLDVNDVTALITRVLTGSW